METYIGLISDNDTVGDLNLHQDLRIYKEGSRIRTPEEFIFTDERTRLNYQINRKDKTIELVTARCADKFSVVAGQNLFLNSQVRLAWNGNCYPVNVLEKRSCFYFDQSTNGVVSSDGMASGTAVAIDCFGNIYITGIFNGTLTLGTLTPLVATGARDIFVAKLNPSK